MYERYNDMRVTGFQDFECIVQTQSTHVSELFAVMPAGMQLSFGNQRWVHVGISARRGAGGLSIASWTTAVNHFL
jgi:hypothetical protein